MSRGLIGLILVGLVIVVLLTVGCGGAGRDDATPYATAAATPTDAAIGSKHCASNIFTALEFDSVSAQSEEKFATDVGWLVLGLRRLFVPGNSPNMTTVHIRESASRFCAAVSDYLISQEFSDPETEMTVVGNRGLIAHLHIAALHDALDADGTPVASKVPRDTFE